MMLPVTSQLYMGTVCRPSLAFVPSGLVANAGFIHDESFGLGLQSDHASLCSDVRPLEFSRHSAVVVHLFFL